MAARFARVGRPPSELWKLAEKTKTNKGKDGFICRECKIKHAGGVDKIRAHYKLRHKKKLDDFLGETQASIGGSARSLPMPGSSSLPPSQNIQGSTRNAAAMQIVRMESEGPSNPGGNSTDPSNDDRQYQNDGELTVGELERMLGEEDPPDTSIQNSAQYAAGQDGMSVLIPIVGQAVVAAGGAGCSTPNSSPADHDMLEADNPIPPRGSSDLDAMIGSFEACLGDDSVPDIDMQDVIATSGGGSSVPEPSFSRRDDHDMPHDQSIHVPPMQIDAHTSNAGNGLGPPTINACSDYGFGGADQPRQDQLAIPTQEMPPADSTQHNRQLGVHMDDPVHSGSGIFAGVRNCETQHGAGQDVLSASFPNNEHAVDLTDESTTNLSITESSSDIQGANSVRPQDPIHPNPTRIGRDRDDAGHRSMDSEVPWKKRKSSLPDLVGHNHTKIVGDIHRSLTAEGISRIGVWGMGGAGKILTLQQLYHRICQNNPDFDVRWVTVSQGCSLPDLQMKIAKATDAPELFNDQDVTFWQWMLLEHLEKKKKLAIILDDLWKPFDLKDAVGVPDCVQIVLTARDRRVWERMSSNVKREFKVEPLSKEEAWLLFVMIRGSEPSPEHKPVAKEIVKRCRGLPLAIRVMAASMRAVKTDHGWRDTLTQLKDPKYAQMEMQEVFRFLRFSYDCLDKIKQQCLLLCALYPEDHEIKREELIELCIDEKLISGNRRREMYDRGHRVLDELEKACLLERIVKERWLGEGTDYYVKMHDLIRGMSLNIVDAESSCPYLVKSSLPGKDEWRSDIQKASLMMMKNWDIEEILSISPACPQLSTLLFRHCWGLRKISDCFFEKLHGLKVFDLSHSDIEELPTSIVNLKNLEALVLKSCVLLSTLPDSLGELTSLRKLDLYGCEDISEAPRGLEKLVDLRYLDLFGTSIDKIPAGVIGALVELQYLSIDGWTEVTAEEVGKLKKLEALICTFKNVNEFPKTILRSYNILIQYPAQIQYPAHDGSELREDFYMGQKSITLRDTKYAGKTCRLPMDVKQLIICRFQGMLNISRFTPLERLVNLQISDCCEMLALSGGHQQQELPVQPRPDHDAGRPASDHFPNLKKLSIYYCPKLVHLMVGGRRCNMHLTKLEVLHIENCEELEGLVDTTTAKEMPPDSFSQLRVIQICSCPNLRPLLITDMLSLAPLLSKIYVYKCNNMKRLLTLDTFMLLPNLDSIYIWSCNQMEEVIGQDGHVSTSNRDTNTPLSGSGRLELVLRDLPELKSICSWSPAILRRIRTLDVRACPNIKRIQVLDESPSLPPSLERVVASPPEWWESLEWKYPEAKDALQGRLWFSCNPIQSRLIGTGIDNLCVLAHVYTLSIEFYKMQVELSKIASVNSGPTTT